MSDPIRLLIADDHEVVRQGLRAILEQEPGLIVVGEAADGESALGQQPDLFTQEAYPVAFDKAAVVGLKRHGYPWTALLKMAGSHIQPPHPTDPFFVEIQNESVDRLRRQFEALRQRAERLLQEMWNARETRIDEYLQRECIGEA